MPWTHNSRRAKHGCERCVCESTCKCTFMLSSPLHMICIMPGGLLHVRKHTCEPPPGIQHIIHSMPYHCCSYPVLLEVADNPAGQQRRARWDWYTSLCQRLTRPLRAPHGHRLPVHRTSFHPPTPHLSLTLYWAST